MERLATPHGWTAPAAANAVSLPRRHVVAIAALVCVPLPLLSFGAMVLPLPQFLERGAARFAALAAPSSADGDLIRERAAGRALEIRYRADEPLPEAPIGTSTRHAAARAPGARLSKRPDGKKASPAPASSSAGAVLHPLAPEPEETPEPVPSQSPKLPTASAAAEIAPADTTPAPPASGQQPASRPTGEAQDGGTSGTGSGGTAEPGAGGNSGNGGAQDPGGGGQAGSGSGGPTAPPGAENGNGSPPESPPGSSQAPSPPGHGRP